MDNMQKEIEKIIKPSPMYGILFTLICFGPVGHLIFNIATENHGELMKSALLSIPTLIAIGAYWVWHIFKMKNLSRDVVEVAEMFSQEDKE